ncbi:biotin/lipoyl-binding carrier protein [Modestobacter italicus]|uniref:biotin/lipoyl-binding carrier protein n=1 Tax=Modestobacter italicus (strain DSM 44449 / CECT 9708 / BC 501) TaxID=2732864 RepID=UPI001FE2BEAB|nr:biotin/lipoyl-binding carrier protein [Modestobacter italicus]
MSTPSGPAVQLAEQEAPVAVQEVHAEMVSSVWKVLVAPGAEVAAGDTLVILESMKMEIPVLTEFAGTVAELHVVEGEVLQEGDLIATVVPAQR